MQLPLTANCKPCKGLSFTALLQHYLLKIWTKVIIWKHWTRSTISFIMFSALYRSIFFKWFEWKHLKICGFKCFSCSVFKMTTPFRFSNVYRLARQSDLQWLAVILSVEKTVCCRKTRTQTTTDISLQSHRQADTSGWFKESINTKVQYVLFLGSFWVFKGRRRWMKTSDGLLTESRHAFSRKTATG